VKMLFDDVWDWFFSEEYPNYIISEKYLFSAKIGRSTLYTWV